MTVTEPSVSTLLIPSIQPAAATPFPMIRYSAMFSPLLINDSVVRAALYTGRLSAAV